MKEQEQLHKIIWLSILALFGLCIWLLFSTGYWGHLHSAEGNQMFLFTSMYANQMLNCPGGAANYIASFILQFSYWHWLGGALVALLLAALAFVVSSFCRSTASYPLALIPSLAYTILLMDSNWRINGLVAILLTMLLIRAALMPHKVWQRVLCILLLLPFVYHYLLRAQFYTYLMAPQNVWWSVVAGTIGIALVCRYWNVQGTYGKILPFLLYAAILYSGTVLVKNNYDALNEEIFRYEYMARTEDWDGIIEYSKNKEQKSPLSTNAINLALAMKGELGNRMFQYFQKGPRSLINFEERRISSEILYHLGFVNEAAHIAFEDMAANPSREKGVYHITRLAKCAAVDPLDSRLLNRYMSTLKHTLFYREFNPKGEVTEDMEPCRDFFFDYGNFQSMLLKMNSQRPENGIVREYLAASLLLTKNLNLFEEMFTAEQTQAFYHIQAQQMISALKGARPMLQLQNYIGAYNAARGNAAYLKSWETSYWYYYNFR